MRLECGLGAQATVENDGRRADNDGGTSERARPQSASGRSADGNLPQADGGNGGDDSRRGRVRSASDQEGSTAAARSVVPRIERAHFARRSGVLGAQATFDDDSWWD